MDYQMLMALLANGDPEALKALAELGTADDEMKDLGGDLKLAQALRATPQPGGTYTKNAYVASSPWEHIAAGATKMLGGVQEGIFGKKIEALRGKQQKTRTDFFSRLAKAYGKNQEPPPYEEITAPQFQGEQYDIPYYLQKP